MPTPNDLTDAEINQRLAEALGLDLTAKTDMDRLPVLRAFTAQNIEIIAPYYREYQHNLPVQNDGIQDIGLLIHWFVWANREGQPWQSDIEAHVAAYRRTPPNWAGNLATAFTLGGEIQKRDLAPQFINALAEQIYCEPFWSIHIDELVLLEVCHATPRQRALAALRTLEEAKQ